MTTRTARIATRRRREELLRHIRAGGGNINDLAQRFSVSVSTIRRDLTALARAGHVLRTYGGAAAPGHLHEPTLRAKASTHPYEKDQIGRQAAALVAPGDLILLDAGTTVGRLAWHLRDQQDITVVTNGISSLLALLDAPGIEVIVLGGKLRRPNEALIGTDVTTAIHHFHPDVTFLGADGVHPDKGVNCPSFEQACLKEQMANAARLTRVLADESKVGSEPYPFWASLPPGSRTITEHSQIEIPTVSSARGRWRGTS